ncbi:MAG: porin [Chitinophagales bacterium]
MRKSTLVLFLFSFVVAHAQLTIGNEKHVLEITGSISAFGNIRIYKPGEKADNNAFQLRDATLQLEGRYKSWLEYELQFNFAQILAASADPENPALMDAYLQVNAPKFFSLRAGYGKLPYSRANLTPHVYSLFYNRSEISRGYIFPQRDVGLTLQGTFWKQRLNVWAGMYNGMGEISLNGKNDMSGKFMYIGRVELSYPIKNRYTEIEQSNFPLPVVTIGGNLSYVERTNTVIDQYQLNVVAGKKFVYGGDVMLKYKGLSITAELHQARYNPTDSARFYGLPTNYFRAGGYFIQADYYIRFLKSAVGLRLDEVNRNDLVTGDEKRLTVAAAYMPMGTKLMVRFNYTRLFNNEFIPGVSAPKWTDQFRFGIQYLLK